ncbi:unnamed protein product [Cylicostephanus goldi]|uniref:Uncharacterized protein n=1 Tax=Cylicostephanus goldi TaxID=71465 RepID=A0A3P7MW24_CYLGO|nr:unnamed protein product [Cylicostephanus goldi]
MPCDPNARHLNLSPGPSDYDAFDPYEADRLEAMRQLYPDMFPPDKEEQKNPNFAKIPKPKSEHIRAHAAPLRESTIIDITKASKIAKPLGPEQLGADSTKFDWVENPEYGADLHTTIRYHIIPYHAITYTTQITSISL